MTIYRIYKLETKYVYSNIDDDYVPADEDVTIKYVDSKEKVDAFLAAIEAKNKTYEKCLKCPIINLSKRQYDNGKHKDIIDSYCTESKLGFKGNTVFCNRYTIDYDDTEYYYEEIEVE